MKILLFGKNGQIGWELQRSLAPLSEVIGLRSDSTILCGNLTNPNGIIQTIRSVVPDIIVNAAAYTAVDQAESEPERAYAINTLAPAILAAEAKRSDAWLIHYSTDYVFDGSGDLPWLETDQTNPLNVYGQTKRDGEIAIQESGCQHLIFRTSWVYATRGNNVAKTILCLGKECDHLKVINDQIGAPTGAELLADVSAHAIRTALRQPDVSGLYNLVASGETSWHGYACFVLDLARQKSIGVKVLPEEIEPVPSSTLSAPAQRPKNSRLNTSKLQNTFGVNLPDWRVGVARMLTEMLEK